MKRYFLLLVSLVFVATGCHTTTSPSDPGPTSPTKQRLYGYVRAFDTDSGVADVDLTLLPENIQGARSAWDGSYDFGQVVIGPHRIFAKRPGYDTVTVETDVDQAKADRVTIWLQHDKGFYNLHVVDRRTGTPLSGATLEMQRFGKSYSYTTGDDGNISIHLDSTMSLQLRAPDHADVNKTINVPSGQTVNDTIIMSRVPGDLLFYFPFDSTVADSSDWFRKVEVVGGNFAYDRFRTPSAAWQLTGPNQYIRIPNASELNFGKDGNFTISFWILNANLPNASSGTNILQKQENFGSNYGYAMNMSTSSYRVKLSTTYGSYTGGTSSTIGTSKIWHLVTIVVDRKFGVSTYFDDDGGYSDGYQFAPGNVDNYADLYIGNFGSTSNFYTGIIDDLRFYRRALSREEVHDLFHERGW